MTEIIRIREGINEIENRKIEKSNETKSWVFERVNKIDKPLAGPIMQRDFKCIREK